MEGLEIPDINKELKIIIIGSGGIVRDAHLPAYKKAGYQVEGLYDTDVSKSQKLANKFNIKKVYNSHSEIIDNYKSNIVFDMAVPASNILEILEWIPENSAVLIQKPLGDNLEQARLIIRKCKEKKIRASVNFQLRYAPSVKVARKLIAEGKIGKLTDIEVRVSCHTPWQLWPFLEPLPRVEILYHSIHYIDLIRSFCGTPKTVYAKTMSHPISEKIANSRTKIIMDYGDIIRANIATNHAHRYGNELEESYVKWEGSKGAIKSQIGVNLDYPKGKPDYTKFFDLEKPDLGWQNLSVGGNWFPDAFIGSMGSVLLFEDGQIKKSATNVYDAFETMAVVEAAYESSAKGGVIVSSL